MIRLGNRAHLVEASSPLGWTTIAVEGFGRHLGEPDASGSSFYLELQLSLMLIELGVVDMSDEQALNDVLSSSSQDVEDVSENFLAELGDALDAHKTSSEQHEYKPQNYSFDPDRPAPKPEYASLSGTHRFEDSYVKSYKQYERSPRAYSYNSDKYVSVYKVWGHSDVTKLTPDSLSNLIKRWREANNLSKNDFYCYFYAHGSSGNNVESGFHIMPYDTRFANILLFIGFRPSDVRLICAMFGVRTKLKWPCRTFEDICAIAALEAVGVDKKQIEEFYELWSDKRIGKNDYPHWHRETDEKDNFVRWWQEPGQTA